LLKFYKKRMSTTRVHKKYTREISKQKDYYYYYYYFLKKILKARRMKTNNLKHQEVYT
jgi:hypothetical protein